jgi:glycerol kinase
VSSCAWQLDSGTGYALEGFVPNAGGVVSWLRQLGVVADGEWPGIRAGTVRRGAMPGEAGADPPGHDPAGQLWCVPALFGLGTPRWGSAARADIIGLDAASTAADIAEAAMLGVVHQIADAVGAVRGGLAGPLELVRVDGGLGRNDSVLQAIADLAGIALERPAVTEATALGAGALAGLGAGLWDLAELGRLPFDAGSRVTPALPEAARAAARSAWQAVLSRSLAGWQAARPGHATPAGDGGVLP